MVYIESGNAIGQQDANWHPTRESGAVHAGAVAMAGLIVAAACYVATNPDTQRIILNADNLKFTATAGVPAALVFSQKIIDRIHR